MKINKKTLGYIGVGLFFAIFIIAVAILSGWNEETQADAELQEQIADAEVAYDEKPQSSNSTNSVDQMAETISNFMLIAVVGTMMIMLLKAVRFAGGVY